jgi:BASS family bile acid:Na+ symporter
MLERYLIVWLTLLSGLAYGWTAWFPSWGDPFVGSKPAWDYLFGLTMFLIGWMLPRDEIRQVIRRWPMVLSGTALQYTAMPLLGVSMAWLFGLAADQRLGLILVGCVPGAMASNVLTLAGRGNVSYSVSLTTASTLLSPLVVPLSLKLALGQSVPLSPLAVSLKLLWTVVLPVIAGHLMGRLLPKLEAAARRVGPVLANLTILWIIAGVVALNRSSLSLDAILLASLLTVNLLGYAAGCLGGRVFRLPGPMTRALILEIGMQNAGLGTILAASLFPERPGVTVPCAIYTFGCVLTATLLVQAWVFLDDRGD